MKYTHTQRFAFGMYIIQWHLTEPIEGLWRSPDKSLLAFLTCHWLKLLIAIKCFTHSLSLYVSRSYSWCLFVCVHVSTNVCEHEWHNVQRSTCHIYRSCFFCHIHDHEKAIRIRKARFWLLWTCMAKVLKWTHTHKI